jgi:hypothetical protein
MVSQAAKYILRRRAAVKQHLAAISKELLFYYNRSPAHNTYKCSTLLVIRQRNPLLIGHQVSDYPPLLRDLFF